MQAPDEPYFREKADLLAGQGEIIVQWACFRRFPDCLDVGDSHPGSREDGYNSPTRRADNGHDRHF
jgi:hypothetical protein